MSLYHGTNILDAESILKEGFIFSRAILKLRREMSGRGFGERNISLFLNGLGRLLPVELSGSFDRERTLENLREYSFSRGVSFLFNFRGKEVFPWEALLDQEEGGVWFFEDNNGLIFAKSSICSKCRSISMDKFDNPEGVVFEADFSYESPRPRFCRPINVSDFRKLYLFYRNPDTIERILPLAKKYNLPFYAELYSKPKLVLT